MEQPADTRHATSNTNVSTQHGQRLPPPASKALKRWYMANLHNPRPSDAQKRLLQGQTGLTIQQITNWFANARRRGVRKLPIPITSELYQGGSASMSVPNVGSLGNCDGMNPFERWRNSPPEQEPASMTAIANAINQFGNENHTTVQSMPVGYIGPSSIPYGFQSTHSDTSFESMSSFWNTGSDSSAQSGPSDQNSYSSTESFVETSLAQRRRRRRSFGKHQRLVKSQRVQNQNRLFQCTFCTDIFKTKYDWVRHEGTLHLVLERWTCAPGGPVCNDSLDGVLHCAFCGEANPSDSHVALHNYDSCSQKPLAERTFRRKDHLRQHLRLIHGICEPPHSINTWKSTMAYVKSRCGFCGDQFILWPDRNEHLAEHFREGMKMEHWKGDRGLDASTALLVENAIPPYLIGTESNQFEPFSATRSRQASSSVEREEEKRPDRFQNLLTQLAEFVKVTLRNNIVVTDELLRKQARLFMYGDDDAWNQTPADNDDWLRFFKSGLGIGVSGNGSQADSNGMIYQMVSTTPPPNPNIYHADPNRSVLNWPLAWQAPECLAEFRLLQQSGLVPVTSELDLSGQAPTTGIFDTNNPSAYLDNLDQSNSMGLTQYNPDPVSNMNFLPTLFAPEPDASVTDNLQWLFVEDMQFPMDPLPNNGP